MEKENEFLAKDRYWITSYWDVNAKIFQTDEDTTPTPAQNNDPIHP